MKILKKSKSFKQFLNKKTVKILKQENKRMLYSEVVKGEKLKK